MCFESGTIVCYCFHVARIHGTWNQKEGVVPLTVTPNNPLKKTLIVFQAGNFMHVDLEILVPMGRILSPEGKTMAPVNGQ